MLEHREYYSIFPLICGILIFISLFTPYMHHIDSNTKIWLIGLKYEINQDNLSFSLEIESLLKGVIVFISFLYCSISLIRTFFMIWRAKWKAAKIKKIWLISGLVLIFTVVINNIFLMLAARSSTIILEFGTYGPIVAGVILFIGLFLYRNA